MKTTPQNSPARRKKMRLYTLLGMLAFFGLTVFLILQAFEQNIRFFVTPSDLEARALTGNEQFRLGGLVETGTVLREEGTLKIGFTVTDGGASIVVEYEGILPDLFREGQGVVVEGQLDDNGIFQATTVLAKHDENYMPAEVAEALKESGYWQDGEAPDSKPDDKDDGS